MFLLLAASWIVLITLEVKAGFADPLKIVYGVSIPLAFAGFCWAWAPASWAKAKDGTVSKVRVFVLAIAATVVSVVIAVVLAVNYKFAIGGTV